MAKQRIGSNPLDSLIPDPQAGKEAEHQDGKTGKQNTSKTVKQQGGKDESDMEAEKVKATYYLPADVEAELESVWLQLRRLTGRKVSKSEIVTEALRALAADVEQKGERSSYAKRLR